MLEILAEIELNGLFRLAAAIHVHLEENIQREKDTYVHAKNDNQMRLNQYIYVQFKMGLFLMLTRSSTMPLFLSPCPIVSFS